MAKDYFLAINFHHYWYVDSGIHRGKTQEALKDEDGFPYISDQQLHGVMKDICRQAEDNERIKKGVTKNLFGRNNIHPIKAKWLQVNSANLSDLTKEASKKNKAVSRFYKILPSNSLGDDDAVAKKRHLRKIEAVVPITLYSRLQRNLDADCSNDEFSAAIKEFEKAFKGRQRIGKDKNSGFGRCSLELMEIKS